jgi:phytoene dehydrogenase-like protein
MDSFDIVIIGSGINSLVCAAMLTRKGKRVCVFERNAVAGGCIRTEEITVPGFRHDLFSMSYPLFVMAPYYPLLKPDLEAAGVSFVSAKLPTGVVLPDGRALVFSQSREENVAAMNALAPGDGDAYRAAMEEVAHDAGLIFPILTQEPWSWTTAKALATELYRRGPRGLAAFFGDALPNARSWLEREFRSDLVRALIAPWILHTGLGPDDAMSALMAKVIMFTLEAAGNPVVVGGSSRVVDAFRKLIEAGGGVLETNADVARVIVENNKAAGVETTTGRRISASTAVICNVTPTQLYTRLLPPASVPDNIKARARAYTYGRADMQIHLALSAPPQWTDPKLADVALIHLTPGLNGVSRAVREAEAGLLPAEGTIVVGQPARPDPSRCPPGQSLIWIQLQELPRVIRGDAAGEIAAPADGAWTAEVAQAYAQRVLKRLARHITNLDTALIKSAVLSPADLERYNINLVGGDPYSGACSLNQFHAWRPFPGGRNHRTFVDGLYHIGASTHPGPGLGGLSGYLAAADIA